MLSKLPPRKLAGIRNKFDNHPLFVALQETCSDCCALNSVFQFRPEHVFIEVISLVDMLREKQEDIVWTKLFRQIRQDYKYLDSSIPDKELNCISAIICTTLSSVLVMSIPIFYHKIGEQLMQQVFAHDNDVPRESLYELCDSMEKYEKKIKEWFEEYIQSNDFISVEFDELYSDTDLHTELGEPTHIRFIENVDVCLRQEFLEKLRNAIASKQEWGKAGRVKSILYHYEIEVIILEGSEMDIYNDLHTYYGYNQSYKTFSAAKPKLSRT